MMRTASIKLVISADQAAALAALQTAYADACNRLVPPVQGHRLWNRVGLHNRAYSRLRAETPLGSQMVCNAIYTVCKAYKAQKALGRIRKDTPVPSIRFARTSVRFDKRTYSRKGEMLSLYSLGGRIAVSLLPGEHQRRILKSGAPTEAELLCRKGQWYFNLVVASDDAQAVASGPVMGLDVDPAYSSRTCSCCGCLGRRAGHRFVCEQCGLRAHADLNASRNLARIGGTAVLPRAAVNTPDVENVGREIHVPQ